MNQKHIIYFLFAIALGFTYTSKTSAQNSKGDRLFNNKEYASAIHYYEQELEKTNSADVKRNLITCYLKIQKNSDARYLLKNLVESSNASAEDFLRYANILKRLHNYEEAKIYYKKYAALKPENKNISKLLRSCNLIDELKDKNLYNIKSISINSPQSDFASGFYKNGLVFVSGRKNKTSRSIDDRSGEYYLDLYFSEKSGDNYLQPKSFSEKFNTKYHEGPACFSANEKFIFFTRNKGNLNLEGKSELNLYTARHNGADWDKAELFQFSGTNFSMGHPSISPDGRYLFFISDMEGGYGGTDIYVCRKFGFSWSKPINCGSTINTNGNEMFPFIADDGYLYFASDGHVGFGGLDIFKSVFEQNEWSFPVNLGPPFNTPKDDFGYLIRKDKDFGYFSSNRNGSDDIFLFETNQEKVVPLKGRIITKKAKTAIKDAEVILIDNLSKEKTITTDKNGVFSLTIFKGKTYSLLVTKAGFKTKKELYFPDSEDATPKQLDIVMDPTPWVKLKGNIIDLFSARAIKDAEIQIVNQTYKNSFFCYTDDYGEFEQDIESGNIYDIIIRKEGYFTKVIYNYKYNPNLFEQIELQKYSSSQEMELYGVDYQINSWELSENTISELNNLVGLLKVNPYISIEIHGYTNHDKGKKNNKNLCMKRAETAANHLISNGITPNRVKCISAGFNSGKSPLVVRLTEEF